MREFMRELWETFCFVQGDGEKNFAPNHYLSQVEAKISTFFSSCTKIKFLWNSWLQYLRFDRFLHLEVHPQGSRGGAGELMEGLSSNSKVLCQYHPSSCGCTLPAAAVTPALPSAAENSSRNWGVSKVKEDNQFEKLPQIGLFPSFKNPACWDWQWCTLGWGKKALTVTK